MKTDEEIRKSFNLEKNPDGLLILTFSEEQKESDNNTRSTELVLAEFSKFFSADPEKKFDLVVDMSPIEGANYISEKSRELFISAHLQDHINKVAIVSSSILLRASVTLIAQLTGKGDSIRWFETKDEGLTWLKS